MSVQCACEAISGWCSSRSRGIMHSLLPKPPSFQKGKSSRETLFYKWIPENLRWIRSESVRHLFEHTSGQSLLDSELKASARQTFFSACHASKRHATHHQTSQHQHAPLNLLPWWLTNSACGSTGSSAGVSHGSQVSRSKLSSRGTNLASKAPFTLCPRNLNL